MRRTVVLGFTLVCGLAWLAMYGCSTRRIGSYRLLDQLGDSVLIPPSTAKLSGNSQTFTVRVPDGRADCEIDESGLEVARHRNRARISIEQDTLTDRQPGWLTHWADFFSEQGCLSPTLRRSFVRQVAESFPLGLGNTYGVALGQPFRTLYSDFLPGQKLKVVGPVFRDNTGVVQPAIELVSAPKVEGDGTLTIVARSSPNLIGYEESWYSVRAEGDGGLSFAHERTDFFRDGEAERLDAPETTGIDFMSQSRFIRMIYITRVAGPRNHDVLFIFADTRKELEVRSTDIVDNPGRCFIGKMVEWCTGGPYELSFNLYVTVTFNGADKEVAPGTSIGLLLRDVVGGSLENPVSALEVFRPYGKGLARVEFDPLSKTILSLPLHGGERIRLHDMRQD